MSVEQHDPAAPGLGPSSVGDYATRADRQADRWVHGIGLSLAAPAVLALLAVCLGRGQFGQLAPLSVYALCLLATFAASAAYNLTRAPGPRSVLRRFDHAAIFLMIAGSYTPFTTQRLTGGWAWGTTAVIWAAALVGVAGKLFFPGHGRRLWLVAYLVMGWTALVAIKPLISGVPAPALILLGLGGAIYSAGVVVYVNKALPFRRAIWHGFVLAAASIHYGAVLTGVVFAPAG